MAVSVACPDCDATFPVSEALLGKKMRCKACQATFVAEAAKVAVGASSSKASPKRSAPPAKPKAAGGPPLAMIGGGVALAAMIGVTVWALFFRETGKSESGAPVASSGNTGPRIGINDSTPAEEQPKETATPKKETKPAVQPKETPPPASTGPATFAHIEGRLPFEPNFDVVERVKRSAAWIKVGRPGDSGGYGSGWFAEPGIVITNSHVVGMKEATAPPPTWLKVVLNAGLTDERTLPATVIGLDRENDLAVLRVEGDNLPAPMPIARSSDLVEGQRLYTYGFPRPTEIQMYFSEENRELAQTLKVRQTTVAGRLATHHGSIKLVQIEGGADPGNSGSMVVDTGGHVRMIHVMGNPMSPVLKFTIPSEYAVYLLQGRILRLVGHQPYEDGGAIKQRLDVFVADPMKRIRDVALEVWTGDRSKGIRPGSTTAPSPLPSDGPRKVIPFKYDPNAKIDYGESSKASAEWEMMERKNGTVYWIQPRYTDHQGQNRWGEAIILETDNTPVQRKPALLRVEHKAGNEYNVKLRSEFAIGSGVSDISKSLAVAYDIKEKTVAVQKDGSAKNELRFSDIRFIDKEEDDAYRGILRGAMEAARTLITEVTVTNRGDIRMPKADMNKVPAGIRPLVDRFNIQTVQSLETMSIPMPNREVQPGETWKNETNYSIALSRTLVENALFRMNYTYTGTRVRDGREEAVIECEGTIVKVESDHASGRQDTPKKDEPKGKGKDGKKPLKVRGLFGQMRGAAYVDLATGQVTVGRMHGHIEIEVPSVFAEFTLGAALRINLERQVTKQGKFDRGPALPNSEILLNPFVGAPNVALMQN